MAELSIEVLRTQKRYSTKPIRISKQEVEYLAGYPFKEICEDMSTGYCRTCDELENVTLAPIYSLEVDALGIRFKGICNKCKKEMSLLLGIDNRMEYIFNMLK